MNCQQVNAQSSKEQYPISRLLKEDFPIEAQFLRNGISAKEAFNSQPTNMTWTTSALIWAYIAQASIRSHNAKENNSCDIVEDYHLE